MKNGEFYDAWCTLERVEIDIGFLEKHYDVNADSDRFKIAYIKSHTERFQSIFPYAIFTSPGMLHLEERCSICSEVISPRNHCGHIVGEIYDGEMCGRTVTKARITEISMVTNPVQKYSVPFLRSSDTDEQVDHYNYSAVNYVIRGLRKPFHEWAVRRTHIRHPHSMYRNLGRNDPCPCESGEKYKHCCMRENGILRPHMEITFSVPPPKELPIIEYPD